MAPAHNNSLTSTATMTIATASHEGNTK